MGCVEELRGGVDVIDVEAVDSDGGEEATVFGDCGQVFADIAVFEKDAGAGVAALDGAVGVVPLVDPAEFEGWVGLKRSFGEAVGLCDETQEGERTVKSAAFVAARDDDMRAVPRQRPEARARCGDPIRLWGKIRWNCDVRIGIADLVGCADQDAILEIVRAATGSAVQARDFPLQLGGGGSLETVLIQSLDRDTCELVIVP